MKRTLACDVEIYRNYFLVGFKDADSGQVVTVDCAGEDSSLSKPQREMLYATLTKHLIVGFNIDNYDLCILAMAAQGRTAAEMKACSDDLIERNMFPWDVERKNGFLRLRPPAIDMIDLMNIPLGQFGLKTYAARLHAPKMRELPYDPAAILTPSQIENLKRYHGNDLDCTLILYERLKPEIELRRAFGAKYDLDLRSKSDAQIAEMVIKKRMTRRLGHEPSKPSPTSWAGKSFLYRAPKFLDFTTDVLRDLLAACTTTAFQVARDGKVDMPAILSAKKVTVGGKTYSLGIGGLHSNEKSQAVVADEDHAVIDRDVTSYYPYIILGSGIYPKALGPQFLDVFRAIVDTRVQAKRDGDKTAADGLKIVVNSCFGKFGSPFSLMYSPDLMIHVTLTGQLSLLLLIERAVLAGIEVMSANTDGVVFRVLRAREAEFQDIIRQWEADTTFATEETRYKALYSRDVNTYLAIGEDGKVKTKGALELDKLSKNPTNDIVMRAVIEHVTKGVPIRETVMGCDDVRKFIAVRAVRGGALKDGEYVGKVIRSYYSTDTSTPIVYKSNGNKVPKSDGSRPCMDLPNGPPADLDRERYVREAEAVLVDIGFRAPYQHSVENRPHWTLWW